MAENAPKAASQPRLAVVTGASSGIGLAFAQRLAARGYDLLLVARRGERLAALAADLRRDHGIAAEPLTADLSRTAEVEALAAHLAEQDGVRVLVNNAGFGTWGTFVETDLSRHLAMIEVHVGASVRLCHAVLPGMIARRGGAIVNVSSIGAFAASPQNVTYCATKAFLVLFSEGLHAELRGTGVRVQALCPGFTRTDFHDTPDYAPFDKAQVPAPFWLSADDVVTASFRALRRDEAVCVPGLMYRVIATVLRTGALQFFASQVRRPERRV
jgi:short-subunit dehydrogenase